MTLQELQKRVQIINPGGCFMPTFEQYEVHQKRVFALLTQWCEPLNLLIAYDDRDIDKIVDSDWRLKKPLIAKVGADFIDIDERLEDAFVYAIISILSKQATVEKIEFEDMAYREALEYASGILTVGYDNAKRIYEQESFIKSVEFDCLGRIYHVSSVFVDLVIDCILCGRQCLNSAEYKQLELYKKYVAGNVRAVDKEKLIAVDNAVFHRLMNDAEKLTKYSSEDLNRATTLFCEFSKLDQGKFADAHATVESKRMGWMECDKPMCCNTNNRCEGM